MTAVNELFRDHVHRISFQLTLTKTQIDTLVELDAYLNHDGPYPSWVHWHMHGRGITGLERRGLVRQINWWHPDDPPTYEVTKAGELVVGLLKEAGLYQQFISQGGSDA
jgi:hypothetical protein